MASAEDRSVHMPSEVGYAGEGCPLPSWLRGLGSVVSSPSGVRGRKRILAYFEGHSYAFLYLYDKIWGFALASPFQILGDLFPCPRDLRPWKKRWKTFWVVFERVDCWRCIRLLSRCASIVYVIDSICNTPQVKNWCYHVSDTVRLCDICVACKPVQP